MDKLEVRKYRLFSRLPKNIQGREYFYFYSQNVVNSMTIERKTKKITRNFSYNINLNNLIYIKYKKTSFLYATLMKLPVVSASLVATVVT